MANEREIPTALVEYTGTDSIQGPKSVILVGVHGDESAPILAYSEFKDQLHIEQGQLWIGYGNPRAVEQGTRKIEADLNRMFKPEELFTDEERKSYERQRADYLKPYLDRADALLDVHSTKNPEGVPFVIAEPKGLSIVSQLPFERIVSGFDEFEPGGTDYYMNTVINHIGICAESGYSKDPISVNRAKEAMFTFLQAQGHLSPIDITRLQKFYRVFYMHLTETNFTRTRNYPDFEPLEAGHIIGTDGEKEVSTDRDCVILFGNMDVATPDEDVFLLAEPTESLI